MTYRVNKLMIEIYDIKFNFDDPFAAKVEEIVYNFSLACLKTMA